MLALAYAAAYPGSVASLALIGCGTFDAASRARFEANCNDRIRSDTRAQLAQLETEVPDPDARLFVHVFCHRDFAYPFETEGSDNWMGRYFFTGGQMPSFDLLGTVQDSIPLEESWAVPGRHYAETSEGWLRNMDEHRDEIMPILEGTYGKSEASRWFQRWRIFFLACAELFGYADGEEWFVGHYLFGRH